MKKLYCVLLLFVILLTGTSCDNSSNKNGNSSTEINGLPNERQLPKMLIADHNGHYLPQGAKSDFSRVDTSWKNDELTGTVIENLLGKDYTLPYDYNRCFDGFKFDYVFYISNSPFTCAAINSETGQLIYHAEPYPEYDAETIRAINISEAETIATNTIKTYYEDVIDLNKYELTEKIETTYEGGLSYKFTWKKYIKGVKTGRIIIYVTQNGEIVSFEYDARDQAEDKIPDYTKEEYLEACQIRLQEIYDEVGYQGYNDVKITSIEFFETTVMIASDFQSAYMRDIEKYCIECPVIYQFEYGDGKTNSGTAFLYYPYAE